MAECLVESMLVCLEGLWVGPWLLSKKRGHGYWVTDGLHQQLCSRPNNCCVPNRCSVIHCGEDEGMMGAWYDHTAGIGRQSCKGTKFSCRDLTGATIVITVPPGQFLIISFAGLLINNIYLPLHDKYKPVRMYGLENLFGWSFDKTN